MKFEVVHRDRKSNARIGRLELPHGVVETPAFMPVGTQGTVKALDPEELEEIGAEIILANTYHLFLRPGAERVERFGGLHQFMHWPHPILTDSGGYQVFSLGALRKLHPDGVAFQSHLDGSRHFFTPEKVVDIQHQLGSDILMPLDECTPYPADREYTRRSMELTLSWARRSRRHHAGRGENSLFGIIQGGFYPEFRSYCADTLVNMDFPGYAIGGLSVGESKSLLFETAELVVARLPSDRPRYMMGVGTPEDIVMAVALGVDMFDCVMPTRHARNGALFTSNGRIVIKNAIHQDSHEPLDSACECSTCKRFTRGYLRHLFVSGEILAARLNTLHNLYFYLDLMRTIRHTVRNGQFSRMQRRFAR